MTASVVKTDGSGYAGAATSTYANGQMYTLNARINEISAAMSDRSKLQSNDYSTQRFR